MPREKVESNMQHKRGKELQQVLPKPLGMMAWDKYFTTSIYNAFFQDLPFQNRSYIQKHSVDCHQVGFKQYSQHGRYQMTWARSSSSAIMLHIQVPLITILLILLNKNCWITMMDDKVHVFDNNTHESHHFLQHLICLGKILCTRGISVYPQAMVTTSFVLSMSSCNNECVTENRTAHHGAIPRAIVD